MDADVDGEPKVAIMRATYRALCEHGYAALTMQAIADEAPVSKAALHYHYESKRGLVEAFQSYLAERFFDRIDAADEPDATPPARLAAVLDAVLAQPEDGDLADIQRVLLELKAQAAHDPQIRAEFEEIDDAFRDLLAEIFEAGVRSGDFRPDVDPDAAARFVITVLAGAGTRQVSVGQAPETTRALLQTFVERSVTAATRSPE